MMPFLNISLLIFISLAVPSCQKRAIAPNSVFEKNRQDLLKCLDPYAGILDGRFSQDQQKLYAMVAWDSSAKVVREKLPLSDSHYAIRIRNVESSFTGRFMIYENLGGSVEPIGSIAECTELKHDDPSLRALPETNWIESKECVSSGTGMVCYWSRYWMIADKRIDERLALPTSGRQNSSYGEPWRTFALEPVLAEFTEDEIAFTFMASCELIYAPEGETDASFVTLPEIRRKIYFSKNASGEMFLNETKSDLTLREFQILTDAQLQFGNEFWEIYADDVERKAQGGEAESIREWIDSNYSENWVIPDKIKVAIGRPR